MHADSKFDGKFRFQSVHLLMLAAPLSVIIGLLAIKNIFVVFITYHIIIAITLPLLDSLFNHRKSFREHLSDIGVISSKSLPGILIGMVCGFVMGGATFVGFLLWGDFFLGKNDIVAAIEQWGVPSNGIMYMFAFMVLFNGIAEELFWRGYVQQRLNENMRPALAIIITAIFYTGYHPVTVYTFFGSLPIAIIVTFAILFAGIIWGILRQTTGNVLAPLLGHIGATVGYMGIYWLYFA